jgi:ferredoxin-thioredoxin reductase catalytic subunit
MKSEEYLPIFERVSEKKGWKTSPDEELLLSFAEGLIKNKERYGMPLCPCRMATGKKEIDRLIICPCVYAAEDIQNYNRCFCGLYLSQNYQEEDIYKPVPDQHFKYYME